MARPQQNNLFQRHPEITEQQASLIATEIHEDGTLISVDHNIVRGGGGGEPRDIGQVILPDGAALPIKDTVKKNGLTWLLLPPCSIPLELGMDAMVKIDAEHRLRRRKLHAGTHMLIRTVKNLMGCEHVESADIDDNATKSVINLTPVFRIDQAALGRIDKAMRTLIQEARPIYITKAKSIGHAQDEFGALLRVSNPDILRGKVRLVVIEGFDVNPCSGLHYHSTDIGPIYITVMEKADNEVELTLRLADSWPHWYGELD